MLVYDLRVLVFVAILLALLAGAAGWCLARRPRRNRPVGGSLAGIAELDGAPFGLLVLGKGDVCLYANSEAYKLLGLPAGPAPLPSADWVRVLAADRQAVRAEGQVAGRYRSLSLGAGLGGPFVRWWVTPAGEADLVLLFDQTAQQQAEEAARSFLNDLSHELRTPLATLLTHLEVLSLPAASEDVRRQSVALLKAEGQRMARLIHQMLELGRLETSAEVEKRPLNLLLLAEDAIAQLSPQAEERRVALGLEAATPLPPVAGDGDRLRQVFLNLLDNAIKYARTGDRAVVSLQPAQGGIRCAVCDSGPGIAAEHLPHLARRFYRAAPPEVEGSGLGLALVAEILRRHGASLQVKSRTEGEETGTCVSFVLPVLEP